MTDLVNASGFAGARCIVTGAGGFLGTNLSRRLSELGASCLGIGRSQAYPSALNGIEWRHVSLDDLSGVEAALAAADFLFHLAGGVSPSVSERDPSGEIERSLGQMLRLLDTAANARFVFLSSGGTVYGPPNFVPIHETHPTDPISAYGVEKLTIEKYLRVSEHRTGRQHLALRLSNPFGPYQNPLRGQGVVAALAYQIDRGLPIEIWGDGTVVRDFLYVSDVVEAILHAALYSGPERVFNVGSGMGRSVNSVLADLLRIRGIEHHRVDHKTARPADVPINILDISRISSETGWAPSTSWDDGLRQTFNWIQDEHRWG